MTTKPTSPATKAARREFRAGQKQHPMMAELYRRAEAQLKRQKKNQKAPPARPVLAADPQRQFHELQVHQVELEMQNIALQKTRDELELALGDYTDLYDFAPVGYFTLAADSAIQQANLTGASLVGIDRSRLLGRCFDQLFAVTGSRAVFRAFLRQVFAGQTKQSGDFELLHPGQPPRAINIKAQRSLYGDTCRIAVVDVTEHKKAEDLVRVSEVRYRRLFEAAHDGVLLLDPATRKITDANPFMTKLLGYSHEQLVGRELFEIGLLKDEAASQEMFRKLKVDREIRYEDLPLESQSGRHQEVEVVANLYQENGHAVIQCNIRDITARKQAEEALRESDQRMRLATEATGVGIWEWNLLTNRILWDAELFRIYGVAPTTDGFVTYETWRDAVLPEDLAVNEAVLQETVRRCGRSTRTFRIRRGHDGEVRSIEAVETVRTNAQGQAEWVVGTNLDITARKQAEETQRRVEVLAASNQKLEKEIVRRQAVESSLRKSEQHQNQLLEQSRLLQEQLRQLSRQILTAQEEERREISRELHDVIAQTLTGINIRLAGLKQDAARNAKGLDRNIARTQRQVEKSVDIVHQFARELRPAALDDLGLIPALHAFMKSFTTRTGVRTRLTAFAAVEKLEGSKRTVLYRVAQEALTNVARHAKASRVDVSIQKLPGGVCMKIKDDGKSFDVERVLRTTGKGRLGLLGMRERLQMVGGSFEVESAPGQGTTIVAHLPLGKVARGGGGGTPKC